jgi:tetratricopeptide (TPR) repeat protein
MRTPEQEALHLCELGLQKLWRGEADAAAELFDRALLHAETDPTRELITIRKAEALIATDREGEEVSALAVIVMRRRLPRHVYLAANALTRRFLEREDRKRALMYGEIARRAAEELGDAMSVASVLNTLGITLVADSQFSVALEALAEAKVLLSSLDESREEVGLLRLSIDICRGGALVLLGEAAEGVDILEKVLPFVDDDYTVVETCLDLCYGYMQLHRDELAESYGQRALRLASIARQVRNANHLLGEISMRLGRYDDADRYFDVVAGFYPEFRNVKQLLVAVDVCSLVNWKA